MKQQINVYDKKVPKNYSKWTYQPNNDNIFDQVRRKNTSWTHVLKIT